MTQVCRILVVEDNDLTRRYLRLLLEEGGHDVQEADDGLDGVRLILSWKPDIAVVDIDMPIVDGFGVARRVREILGNDVRLIALTGHDQRERCLSAGFDEFLLKPADPEQVRQLIGGAA